MGHGFGHGARHYHSMGSHHFGRHVCNCLCCFFCIGPLLFLIGFGMLISSLTDFRTPHIDAYNAAVNTWVGSGDPSNYENTYTDVTNVSMVFDNWALNAQLPNTSTPESFIDDSDERILSYDKFVRFTSGGLVDLTGSCSQYAPWYGCDISPLASFQLFVKGKSIYHASVPAFTRVRSFTSERNCNSGDYWDSFAQTCDSYSKISSICLKIRQTGNEWNVDPSYSGPGCGVATWQPVQYQRMFIYSSMDFPKVVYVPLTVRSVGDPRVAFHSEMGPGATNFGLSQGSKARTGIALLSVGGIILLFLFVTCCKLTRLDKHHRYYEEVRAPVMVVAPQPVVYYQQPQPQPVVYYQQPQPAVPGYPPPYQQPGYYQPPVVYAPNQ